ncbi:putative reticulon-like protein RtnA short variant [Lipomyces arxii]|uniref:putative reticulon-like protein RtnA short variant n=1 Tax=Lipomyces arxii TaxID=56418 RepID=UPI0034D00513
MAEQTTAEAFPALKIDAFPQFAKYKTTFSNLFTWKSPYVSGAVFAASIVVLYLVKYVNVVKLVFNAAYVALGTAIIVEFAGRTIKGESGFVSSFKSGGYFVISKDVVDPLFAETVALTNFGLVELQQIVFVEHVSTTIIAFVVSYFVYILVNYVSLYALAFTAIIAAFTGPIVYRTFQTEIDQQIAVVSKMIDDQTAVVKSKAGEHFGKAAGVAKSYVDLGLDKIGYKRNMPPVPKATPVAAPEPVVAE